MLFMREPLEEGSRVAIDKQSIRENPCTVDAVCSYTMFVTIKHCDHKMMYKGIVLAVQ